LFYPHPLVQSKKYYLQNFSLSDMLKLEAQLSTPCRAVFFLLKILTNPLSLTYLRPLK